MPDLTAQASTFRRGAYRVQGYIGYLPQTVVHSGTLSATPTFPATAIAITTSGGSASSVKRGMTVRIETSGGVLKGYCRVASSGTISSTSLPINETSKGGVNLASGDVFKVYDTFRIWDMLVSATAALNKDSRIAYTDQGADPDAIANAGGGFFGFVDDGQTYATVSFPGTSSLNVDPDSASKTYLWAVGDGTITSGTTTTGDITATFPVGFRHVQLIVTDANGEATTRQFPVQVYNRSTTRPIAVSSATIDYSHEDGHSLRFDLPKSSQADISALPDGALVCFFVDEYYGDTRVSYGSNVSGRSHMKFIGHLVRDTAHLDTSNKYVSFEALSPLGILNKTPALPQLMVQNSGSGSLWRHVKTLNTNRMVWYLTRYGSTLTNGFDFVWQLTGTALGYRRIAVTETSSIGAQLRDIAQSVNLLVTCDQLGRILFIQDYTYLSSSDRASRTVIYNTTTADIKPPLEITTEHRGTVKFVRGEGITDGTAANSNKPCFSNAPGNAPAPFGTGSDTLSRQIVDNQTDLNARTGYHFAKVNGLYDGRFVPQGVQLRMPPGYGWWDPAYNEPMTITLAAADNPRGTAYTTSTKWLASSRSLSFDGESGTVDVTYTIDHETTGQPGTTYVKPQSSQNGLPPFPPIDLAMPPPIAPPSTAGLASGTDTLAVFGYAGTSMLLFSNFTYPASSGGPTVTPVALGLNGTFQSVVVDPWSPKYIGTGTAVNIWIATSTRLYTIDDLFGARTTTQRLAFTSTPTDAVVSRVLATERGVQNFVICASYYAGTSGKEGVWIARTTDGTTWSEAQLTGFYNSSVASQVNQRTPTAWVSAKIPGRCYAFAFTATGTNQSATSRLYRSDDYGATWAIAPGFTNAQSLGYCLHFPWQDNDNDKYAYWTKNDTSTTVTLMRTNTLTGVDTTLDLTAPAGSGKAGTWPNAISIASSDVNRNYMLIAGARFNSNHFATAIYSSANGGDTWRQQTTEVDASNDRFTGVRFAPNSISGAYISGEDSLTMGYTSNIAYQTALSMYVDSKYTLGNSVIGVIGG